MKYRLRSSNKIFNKTIDDIVKKYNLSKQKLDSYENYETYINWVSASYTRNYMLDDPIYYYLDYNNINSIKDLLRMNKKSQVKRKYDEISNSDNSINPDNTFTKMILNRGHEFENDIMIELNKRFPEEIVTVADNINRKNNSIYFHITCELMKLGVPIIYQGVLHDKEKKIYGTPDLIVRCDYLKKIVNDENIKFDDSNTLYCIVDIKNSILQLSKHNTVSNKLNTKAFKGQIGLYHHMLNKIQKDFIPNANILPNYAFILAYEYKQDNNIYKTFDKYGVIDFNNDDKKFLDKALESVDWIQLVRKKDNNLNCLDPNHPNLYPNMNCNDDSRFNKVKQELAERNKEITSIWQCGINNRNKALKVGIDKWSLITDSRILGINNNNYNKIIDKMISINSDDNSSIINPKKIKNNLFNWRDRDKLTFYIDFETFNSKFFSRKFNVLDSSEYDNDIIFMIGIGFSVNNKWDYKCLTIDREPSKDSQIKIIKEMNDYIKEICDLNNVSINNVNIFHHSQFEPNMLKKVVEKYNIQVPKYNWSDMLKIFKTEPIILKGALNFSLKTIGKVLYENKLIDVYWKQDSNCKSGLDAMYRAYEIYSNNELDKIKELESIKEYNEVDCKIMWAILNLFAKKA
jgi:predicted RecB family nuclease